MNITATDIKLIELLAEEGSIDAAVVRIKQEFVAPEEEITDQTALDMAHRTAEIMDRITPREIANQGFAASCSYHTYLRIERECMQRGDSEMALKCRKEIDRLRSTTL